MARNEYGSRNTANRKKAGKRDFYIFCFLLLALAVLVTYKECQPSKIDYPTAKEIIAELDSIGIPASELRNSEGASALHLVAREFHDGIMSGVKNLLPRLEEETRVARQESDLQNLFWSSDRLEKKFSGTKRAKAVSRICLYVETFEDTAIREYREAVAEGRNPVPPSIALGQAILETGIGGKFSDLARIANNHFGYKCGKSWGGDTYFAKDDHYVDGKLVASCFRRYHSPLDSYRDYYRLLNGDRYEITRRYKVGESYTDPSLQMGWIGEENTRPLAYYEAWAIGIRQSGYATSKTYSAKLVAIINFYELWRVDAKVL